MTDLHTIVAPAVQRSETIVWSNYLVNSPAVYSLLEKRVLYYLTLQIKHRFVEQGLSAPEAWKDLYFYLTDKDLGVIGGKTHVLQTYEALSEIGKKFMSVQYYNKDRQLICAKVHWVDAFSYNTETKQYEVRMSPELMPYLINLAKGFTSFSIQTAMQLRSKYSQKFYEFCCEYSGGFRMPRKNAYEKAFKKNVYPITIEQLRYLLDLNEQRDERTGKIKTKGKYNNFTDLKRKVLLPAMKELYELYHEGLSDVWFDCVPFQRTGRKVTAVALFIYSRKSPKEGLPKLWEEGDEPLNPFEDFTDAALRTATKPNEIAVSNDTQAILHKVEEKLNAYLEAHEVAHYLSYIKNEGYFSYDACQQVLGVIAEKERQPKFQSSTRAYKRKSIMHYALFENLKEYGWSLPKPQGVAV